MAKIGKIILNLIKLIFLAVILIVLVQLAVLGIGKAHLRTDVSDLNKADCILVLGAGINYDGSPGPYLQERLDTAIELYWGGYADKLLLSGDNGQVEYNEVASMKDYCLDAGVPAEDIFLDYAGFSTYESMYRAKAVFKVESVIVSTQEFHEYRAIYTGTVLGMKTQGYSAKAVQSANSKALAIREFLAREKDFFKAILRIKPTYLGDEIPITGDGQSSWA